MKHIPLRNSSRFVLVDDRDYERLSKFNWSQQTRPAKERHSPVYARRYASVNGKWSTIAMHREIMAAPPGVVVDHINGDGLDNRRANLRLATRGQNRANAQKRKIGHSKYKGVTARRGYWHGMIRLKGKTIHLGAFPTEVEAARSYDRAAIKAHGKFAKTNFPIELYAYEEVRP